MGERTIEKSSLNITKAIISFQYVERIKSELLIAAQLLGEINELKNEELAGAKKLMLSFLYAVRGEINIAHSVLKFQNFDDAGKKVDEAMESMRSNDHEEAIKRISEAISFITTSGQHAMELLKEKGLL